MQNSVGRKPFVIEEAYRHDLDVLQKVELLP